MPKNNNFSPYNYHSLKTASKKMFELISKQLNVNTAYVTKKGQTAMTVLSSYNKEEAIIPEGYSVDYGGTYCRLIIMNEGDVLRTSNVTKDALTKELDVTGELGVKGFMGVTLKDLQGNVFGTLCVMDRAEKEFTEENKEYLTSIADVLSHLIELDQTKYNLSFLSVPIIPITTGISILTVQGLIDDLRSEKIMNEVLNYGAENNIDHFIIDLSGLIIEGDTFPAVLLDMVSALKLMGIEAIITGVSPQFARQEVGNSQLKDLAPKTVKNIEAALDYIGFTLAVKK